VAQLFGLAGPPQGSEPRVIARATAKNGRTWENEHLFLFAICDGKIVDARLYPDTAKGRDSIAGVPTYPPAATAS